MPWFRVGIQGRLKVWSLRDVLVVLLVVPRGHSLGAWASVVTGCLSLGSILRAERSLK